MAFDTIFFQTTTLLQLKLERPYRFENNAYNELYNNNTNKQYKPLILLDRQN